MFTIDVKDFFHVFDFPLYIDWSRKHCDCEIHNHSYEELVIVRQGSAHNISRFPELKVSQGDVFVIPQGELHRYDHTDNFYIVNILFQLDALAIPLRDAYMLPGYSPLFASPGKFIQENNSLPYFHLNEKEFDVTLDILTRLTQEHKRKESGYKFHMIAMFMELIFLFSRAFKGTAPHILRTHKGMKEALKFMHNNLTKNISVTDIARAAGVSVTSLTRIFHDTTGDTPISYLIKLRVAEATNLLRNSSLNITEIAAATGFSDSNYFTKTFFRKTGLTPTGFRKKIKS